MSYLQLHPSRTHYRARDGHAGVGFVRRGGHALVTGTPLADRVSWSSFLAEFEAYCAGSGISPAFCGVSGADLPAFQARGYHWVKVGDEAMVRLRDVSLQGKAWRECRAALNRADRRGLSFQWLSAADRAGAMEQLMAVSDAWLAAKPLPEMQFLLGDGHNFADARARVAVARNPAGQIEGFVSWNPVPATNSWALDLMRYQPGAMAGLLDFLIVRSLLEMKGEACEVVSLGGVPLSNIGNTNQGLLRRSMDLVFARGSRAYRPASVLHFKQKFNPDWRPLYLTCALQSHLPLALLAVLATAFPGVGLLQLLWGVR